MMDEIVNSFITEVRELLHKLEDDLIGLENNPGDSGIINNVFRLMHTLKGSAGMVGFKNIQDLTHEFESAYEQIREGKVAVTSDIINLTLSAKDLIIKMLDNECKETETTELIDRTRVAFFQEVSQHIYVILFSPDKSIFERGLDPDNTLKEIRSSGAVHIITHEKKKSWEKQREERICQTVWEIYLKSYGNIREIEEIFLFYAEDEFQISKIDAGNVELNPTLEEAIGKLYKNRKPAVAQVKECLSLLPYLKSMVPKATVVPEYTSPQESRTEYQQKADSDSTINVSSHKLDELMNLVSELVTITATIEAHASQFKDPKLDNAIENIEKLTKRFRNNALDLRLVPVGTLLSRFKRQIRDLSLELDKKVNLLIEGQEVEIDKTILKSIESPLQHIIRNSIDHGIEKEEERLEKGKSREGLLKLTAFYSGASVIIQIQDDGNGINLERVKECAIKKGYIQPDQAVTKQELINLIMEPGFTTNENVSLVSGRGVGMDVVRKEINCVGGSLEIFTENGLGTSIIMKLPMTLTIIDTLMVEVEKTQVLIPVLDVEYCFKDECSTLFNKDNRYIQYKNTPVPLASLREYFKYPVSADKETMVIVINKFDRKYAITADRIVGEHQAVIKPLGDLFVNQPFFSGGSIMVDGKLALILDTNFLLNSVSQI